MESLSTQNCLSAPQLEFLRKDPCSDNPGSSEAAKTLQDGSMTFESTPQSLVGRVWHGNMVLGSWTSNTVANSGIGKGICESQKSDGLALGDMYKGVSVREISVTSQSPGRRDTKGHVQSLILSTLAHTLVQKCSSRTAEFHHCDFFCFVVE